MPEPTDTEYIAQTIIGLIETADANHEGTGDYPLTVVDAEPTEDVRSGGSFFEVEHEGRRVTVLIVDEGARP